MAELSFGGIDVSKDRLDVLLLPEGLCFSVCNDASGWAELMQPLRLATAQWIAFSVLTRRCA
jgi:hypothetical protein